MLPGRFPADNVFSPIVFRIAVARRQRGQHKRWRTHPSYRSRPESLRFAVHDRMLVLDHRANLAQHRGEFGPRIHRRRRLMLRFPFCYFFPICFQSHVPSFFSPRPNAPRPLSPRGVQRREQPGTFVPRVECLFSSPQPPGYVVSPSFVRS